MKSHHTYGRRYGRPGGWQQAQQPDASGAAEWFAGRLPEAWFDGDPTVIVDREEITVIGKLAEPEGSEKEESEARAEGRVSRFREETRSERMRIADEAQDRYGRKVSWGVEAGGERMLFTHIAVPVMTRLKQPERQVLDTLVDAGVARSRADALAWSVKLVGEHSEEWLAKLRDAMSAVDDFGDDLAALVAHVVSARFDVDDHVVRHAHRALARPAVGAFLGLHDRDLWWTTGDLRKRPRVLLALVRDGHRLAGAGFPLVLRRLQERLGLVGGRKCHDGLVDPVVVVVSRLGGHQSAHPGVTGAGVHRILAGVQRSLAGRRRQRSRGGVHRRDGLAGLHARGAHDGVDIRRAQQKGAETIRRYRVGRRRRRLGLDGKEDPHADDDDNQHYGDRDDDGPEVALAFGWRLVPRRWAGGELWRWGGRGRRWAGPVAARGRVVWRAGLARRGYGAAIGDPGPGCLGGPGHGPRAGSRGGRIGRRRGGRGGDRLGGLGWW